MPIPKDITVYNNFSPVDKSEFSHIEPKDYNDEIPIAN
jgi:hypothetical protein